MALGIFLAVFALAMLLGMPIAFGMITGTVAQRDVFLDQIKELSVVQDLEVIRGEAVSRVFGGGGALLVQRQQGCEKIGVGQVGLPAVGGEDGGVEVAVGILKPSGFLVV